MRKSSTHCNKSYVYTSTEDSSYSTEFDLLNPRATQLRRRSRILPSEVQPNEGDDTTNLLELPINDPSFTRSGNRKCVESKLHSEDRKKIITAREISNRRCGSPSGRRKYEYKVTFAKGKKYDEFDAEEEEEGGGGGGRGVTSSNEDHTKLWKEKRTPRIVRAVRRNSKKLHPEEKANTATIERPSHSKSSVVILYQGQSCITPTATSKSIVGPSKSDQSIIRTSDVTSEPSPTRSRPIESPESRSPRYSIPRRRIATRRYSRVSRRQEPLNVNIYHKSRVVQVTPQSRDHWTANEGPKQAYLPDKKDPLAIHEEVFDYKLEDCQRISQKCSNGDNRLKEKCYPSDSCMSKLMAQSVNHREQGEGEGMKQSVLSPNLSLLMQHMHSRPREIISDQGCIGMNESDESRRVFPFQPTPSGNLKVIPNQVVFESKKVSVLVADPRHTKVNVKAELEKSSIDVNRSISESSARQGFIDLPPGVTPSAINHLQAHKKLPDIQVEYKPRTQPYKARAHQIEMEQKESMQPTSHKVPPMNEVPLSSLGFVHEGPIDWDNIILPEKTDLYQELARRITNYKNADCIVRIDQDEFHCHLLVLQSYSTFFDEKNSKDIDLTGSNVTSRAFSIIYDWMISPTSESCHLLRRDNILEIFMAAQYLGVKELEEQCWAFIDNDELFTEDTAFLLYMEAKKIDNTAVMELMVPRIMKFFLMLVSTKDFLELSVDELCLLLKSNYICVNSEMEVLMSAVRWLMHDWNNRKQYMLEVLKCVRFGLIAPWQLVDVKRNPENPEFMELMSYPEIQKMVDDGLAFVIIKYWYGNQTEDYYHWIDLLGLSEPTNRNWAGEDKNYVTYREFLLYLEEYQRTKIAELKAPKPRAKPTPPSSPPKDCPSTTRARTRVGYQQQSRYNPDTIVSGQGSCQTTNVGRTSKYGTSKVSPTSYLPGEPSAGVMVSPEMLSMYLNNLDRNNGKVEDRRSHCHCQQRDTNVSSIKKQQKKCKKTRHSREKTDSSKSEEDAATTIQAVYRGYKARRRFDEIKKTSSEEKQKVKRVAELLSAPMGQKLHKPLEPTKVSSGSLNETKGENEVQQRASLEKKDRDCCNLRNQQGTSKDLEGIRFDMFLPETLGHKLPKETAMSHKCSSNTAESAKLLKTIKSPTFFNNCDEITSSFSPSDKTDPDDPFSPRLSATPINIANNAMNKNEVGKRSETRYQAGDNVERGLARSKETQTRGTNYTRPLPQRLSNSLLGPNIDSYFLDNSLFYPDRESVLVFGGVDPHEEYGNPGNSGKDIYRFKPDENLWEFVGEIPEPRHHHSVAYLKGRIYLVGGADPRENDYQMKSIITGTVWSYDPTTRIWYNEAEMLTPRKNFALVVSHGKMYAIGGQDRNGIALRSAEAFDPLESTWREIQPMCTARVGPAGIKYRDFIWVAGGMTKSKKELFSKDVECYDPMKNSWLKMEPLSSPRCFATLYVVSDCLYAIGGASITENSTDSIDCIDIWDPHLCVWKEEAKMSIARHGHCTASIGAQLLIIGGVTTVYMKTLSSVECYCCEQGKWIKGVSPLPYAISGHSTVTLPPANLLVDS
ncbi:hypothetical protein KPH14_009152 [Odynerus spinipes]|uniref:Uncharacterized protein n=1 Tax=Odynerus spinipes TaxID=1348599 RepID=A0AAD9VR92_9HYME|nr:hypothetical protein KPH14_009152 [Odynerus spinipes]